MDLISCHNEYLYDKPTDPGPNANKFELWKFMRDSHTLYILAHPYMLNEILDEYLLVMNYELGLYNNYFDDKTKIKIPKDISNEHLVQFRRFYDGDSFLEGFVDDPKLVDEFNEMKVFYEDLLRFTKTYIGGQYMCKKKFSKQEVVTIRNECFKENFITKCPQRKVSILSLGLDIELHTKISLFKNTVRYNSTSRGHLVVFNNHDKIFTYNDLWDLKHCFNYPVTISACWDNADNNWAQLFFFRTNN